MRKNTIPCPNCHETLLTDKAARQHVKIAAAAQHHITLHEIACSRCGKRYGLITIAEPRDYLFVLIKPKRLQREFKKIWRLIQRGLKIAQLRRKLDEATMWGKRPRCKHAWRFQIHPLGFIRLQCVKCKAEREEPLTAINLIEFVLKPYVQGDKIPKKQRDVIEAAILPRKQQILSEAAKQLDQRLKMNRKRRRKLLEMRRLSNYVALVA